MFSRSDRRDPRVRRDLRVRHLAHFSRAVGRLRCRRCAVCRIRRISRFAAWSFRVQHRDRRSCVACLFVIDVIAALRLESSAVPSDPMIAAPRPEYTAAPSDSMLVALIQQLDLLASLVTARDAENIVESKYHAA